MTTYLLGAVVRLWQHLTRGGISRVERRRARSIAAASTPLHGEVLAPEDQALVDAHHEIYVEIVEERTGEQRPIGPPVRRLHNYRRPVRWQRVAMRRRELHRYAANPLTAPMPAQREVAEPLLFGSAVDDWFAGFADSFLPVSAPFPVLPEEPIPDPLALEGPTGVFSRDWIADVMARAEASR